MILAEAGTANQSNLNITNMVYKEVIWLGGRPVEFEGLMNMNLSNTRARAGSEAAGTRTVQYVVRNSATTAPGVALSRNITFNITWRREGNQVIETYPVSRWSETVILNGQTFVLDFSRSNHEISILREITPGVTYYSGDISMQAVYSVAGSFVVHEVIGELYGFESAWSATETQRLNGIVSRPGWQMQYQVVPSVAVSKSLQYSVNEPTLISFAGNYREVTSNQSGLNYIINVLPNQFYGTPTTGRTTIRTFNSFEQLIAPNLSTLRGHWAYQDIHRLFAMQIITTDPAFFRPDQAISRAEFMTMLARAVKLPLNPEHTAPPVARGNRPIQVNLVFPDLWPNRPDYAYLRAINDAGIAMGRGDGHFHPDEIIWREEAYVLALRVLGLSNLGLDVPLTLYADSDQISDWALNDINAATRIGLIGPDEYGMLHPQSYMTKAQAAALINHLIEYMRHDLLLDYTENMINFMN
jgi:hypothetical protein